MYLLYFCIAYVELLLCQHYGYLVPNIYLSQFLLLCISNSIRDGRRKKMKATVR